LQLGPRTLAGLELVLTKERGMRLAHFRSAGKRSEYVCGEVSGVLVEVLALVLDRVMFQISPIPRASVPYTLNNVTHVGAHLIKQQCTSGIKIVFIQLYNILRAPREKKRNVLPPTETLLPPLFAS
jgi:hypothetical protein